MKTSPLISIFVLALLFSITQPAFGLPIVNQANDNTEDRSNGDIFGYFQNSGELMYVAAGNNEGINFSNGTVEFAVETWLINKGYLTNRSSFTLFDSNGIVSFQNYDTSGTPVTSASNSGTWSVTTPGYALNFYTVKAANAYAMYFVSPADVTGSWSTFDLWSGGYGGNSLEISHFTGYNAEPSEVPEPATLILFGTGLAGLASLRRKRNKQ